MGTFDAGELGVPEGWTIQQLNGFPHVIVLGNPAGGWVSINLKRRLYSGGMCVPFTPMEGSTAYEGRFWKKRIVRDAMEWLEGVMA